MCPDKVFEAKSNSRGLQGSGIASKASVREVPLCLTDRAGPRRKKAELEAEGSTQ